MLKWICLFATLILLIEISDGCLLGSAKRTYDANKGHFFRLPFGRAKRDTTGVSGGDNLDPGMKGWRTFLKKRQP